jgi:hypothetical protein
MTPTSPAGALRASGGLDEFLAALPLDAAEELHAGGSNAVVLAFERNGQPFVVKYVRAGTGLVDGHDAETMLAKVHQLDLLKRECPRLVRRFVVPISVYRGTDGTGVIMPRFRGRAITDLVEESADEFGATLARILTELVHDGYTRVRRRAVPGAFARMHLDRVERRLPVLMERLPVGVLADGLTVNGRSGLGIAELLAQLRRRRHLQAMLDPPWLSFPVHGDLNLGNILVCEPDAFAVLDPRGVLVPWDFVYDLAKMLFSLVGLHNGMRHGFVVERGPGGLTVRLRAGQTPVFEQLAEGFPAFLAGLPALRPLLAADPHWNLRLQASLAMHALAEAPCRLSDPKPRSVGGRHGDEARLELATGLHLMGVVILARLLALDDRELARYVPPTGFQQREENRETWQ